jgi:hypothetical protein
MITQAGYARKPLPAAAPPLTDEVGSGGIAADLSMVRQRRALRERLRMPAEPQNLDYLTRRRCAALPA